MDTKIKKMKGNFFIFSLLWLNLQLEAAGLP